MKIVQYPHPSLFKVCKEVTVFGPELKVLLDSMWDTMSEARGLGLAGNQVELEYAMLTMEGPKEEKLYIVNPKIVGRSVGPANIREGCLSAPGEFVVLEERSSWVVVNFQDETGAKKSKVFEGKHSVCIQHEMDHLLGKSHLQSKSLTKKQRATFAKKWGLNNANR